MTFSQAASAVACSCTRSRQEPRPQRAAFGDFRVNFSEDMLSRREDDFHQVGTFRDLCRKHEPVYRPEQFRRAAEGNTT